jgi:hypothetical protein
LCSEKEIKKKDLSHLHESSFGDDKFVDHVNGDARQRDGCEYPTDFDGPSRVGVILCVQRDRIDQCADENKLDTNENLLRFDLLYLMDLVIVYQNKDGADVSPSDFPKGSRLEAEHRLDVVGEPLGTVTPAHAHSLHKH